MSDPFKKWAVKPLVATLNGKGKLVIKGLPKRPKHTSAAASTSAKNCPREDASVISSFEAQASSSALAPRAANTSPTVPCDNEATEPSMEAATFEDAKPAASEIIKTEKLDDITTETGSEKMDVEHSAESLQKKETMDITAEASESDTSKKIDVENSDADNSKKAESLLTAEMLAEEEKLHEQTMKEEEKLRSKGGSGRGEHLKAYNRQKTEADKAFEEEVKEHRYARLKFLLSKSNLYTSYLQKRMESQSDEETRRQQRKQMRLQRELAKKKSMEEAAAKKKALEEAAKKKEGAEQDQEISKENSEKNLSDKNPATEAVTDSPAGGRRSARKPWTPKIALGVAGRRSARNSPAAASSPAQAAESPGPSKRGRKRKNADDGGTITDYFQKALDEDKLEKESKKRKVEEESEDSLPDAAASAAVKDSEVNNNAGDKNNSNVDEAAKNNEEDVDVAPAPRYIGGELVSPDQPTLMSGGVLRDYQVEGFNWLKVIYENGVNGILADEMGLGKTIQCISAVSYLVEQGVPGPFLVCAPLSTVPNWVSEFQRFAPLVPCILYHGTKDERLALRQQMNKLHHVTDSIKCFPVIVTSYEITMNDRKYMMSYPWKYIIVDEGHRIKNFQCKLIKELKQYRSTHRLLLTGTPLQNSLSELWSLLNFLLPEIFDDLSSFEAWFDIDALESAEGQDKIVEEEEKKNILGMLHKILMPFMLRRLKADVALNVPPKREVLVYAPLAEMQDRFYRAAVNKTIESLLPKKDKAVDLDLKQEDIIADVDGVRQKRKSIKKVNYALMLESEAEKENRKEGVEADDDEVESWVDNMLALQQEYENNSRNPEMDYKIQMPQTSAVNIKLTNILMLLRKVCNHPYLLEYPLTLDGNFKVDEDLVKNCGKFLLLDRMLPELKKRGHKVLIFSQMTSLMDVLGDYCYLRKYQYCRLDGSMNLTERRTQIDGFNKDPELFLFLLSTRAGGLGINLTAADTVIIYDSDWNPQADLQAQDRCHRIGQTRPVMVYRFVTANTIDQKIVERAAAKRKLEKMVILKGKFRDGIRSCKDEMKALEPKELLELLKSKDHDEEVRGRAGQVLSDQELEHLLDRSDLQAMYDEARGVKSSKSKKRKSSTKTGTMQDIEGVFKVLDEEIAAPLQTTPTEGESHDSQASSQSEAGSQDSEESSQTLSEAGSQQDSQKEASNTQSDAASQKLSVSDEVSQVTVKEEVKTEADP